jgi:hypothetical protein
MNDMLNYVKIEEFKHLIITKLKDMGFKEYLEVATEDDITSIMLLSNELLHHMRQKENDEVRIELLVTYIVGLWARLIIVHGEDVNSL